MLESVHAIWIDGGESAVIFTNWLLVVVGMGDARIGVRIYTRAQALINIFSGSTHEARDHHRPSTTAPRPPKTLNGGHYINR